MTNEVSAKRQPDYSEFTQLPDSWTRPQWSGHRADGDRALLNESDPFKWSGDAAPPTIGQRVHCYMNGLGDGTVLAYFVEYGWLGVLVQLDRNPAWRKSQNKGQNPPAHLFGLDLERRKPAPIES